MPKNFTKFVTLFTAEYIIMCLSCSVDIHGRNNRNVDILVGV